MLRRGSSCLAGLVFFFFDPDPLDISGADVVDFLFLFERRKAGEAP